jgi:hypothetical protein
MQELLLFGLLVLAAAGLASVPYVTVRLWRLHRQPDQAAARPAGAGT